jgi:hypothetical protein
MLHAQEIQCFLLGGLYWENKQSLRVPCLLPR